MRCLNIRIYMNFELHFTTSNNSANLDISDLPEDLKDVLLQELEEASYRGSLDVEEGELVAKVRVHGTLEAKFFLTY